MGRLTKQYLRFVLGGTCNVIGSANGSVMSFDKNVCGVAACESFNFYNMKTAEKVASLSEDSKEITCAQLNRDRRFLAIGYADGTVRLFDRKAEDQNNCVVFSGHKNGVNCLAFSNDGLTLASGGKDCTIVLWDIVAESGLFRLRGHKESITHLQFTQNDRFIVSSSKDTFVKVWNLQSQSCIYTLTENLSEVYSFAMVRNDSLLITASSELELFVFDLKWLEEEDATAEPSKDDVVAKKAKETEENSPSKDIGDQHNRFVRVELRGKVLRECKGRALQLAVTPDEALLVCLGSDRAMDIFRIYSEEEAKKRLSKKVRKAKRKAQEVEEDVVIDATSVAKDVTVVLSRIGQWRGESKPKFLHFSHIVDEQADTKLYTAQCLFVNNSVHTLRFAVEMVKNTVNTEDVANLDQLGLREDCRSLSVSWDNSTLASGGGDQIMLWNAQTLKPMNCLRDDDMQTVTAVMFVPGDTHILAATKIGKLYLFNIHSCECVETTAAHEGAIWGLVPTHDKKGFVTPSADKKVKFWAFELVLHELFQEMRLCVREKRVLEVPDEALCASVSPDGKFVVVGLLDCTAAVYFCDTLKFFISLYGHSLPVTCCSISPDSKLVATGSADKSVKIWGLDFGDCHKSLHAHDDVVSSVLFSKWEEDALLWSAGRDGKIKQWNPIKFDKVQTLDRHSAEVRCLAQTSDGQTMFSASHDKSIRVWDITEEIIILQEEEEMEREKDYEQRVADEDDVVPGERTDGEAELATQKTNNSVQATESIIDAIDVVRKERLADEDDPDHAPHPMLQAFRSKTLDHFVLDVIASIRSSNVERSLLLVPLSYVSDILQALTACVMQKYKIEFANRVAVFLIRIHHSHIINNVEMVSVVDKLRKNLPMSVENIREMCGVNLAALRLFAQELEEASEVRLWADHSAVADIDKATKKHKKQRIALLRSVV